MELSELYKQNNCNYDDVKSRLLTDERIAKYLSRFPKDTSLNEFKAAFNEKDITTAYRAVHTLKGTAATLGLTTIQEKATLLCDRIKAGIIDEKTQSLVTELEATASSVLKSINDFFNV